MYEVFNMGHRMEIYCDNSIADNIISISKNLKLMQKLLEELKNQKQLFLKSEKKLSNINRIIV